MIRVDGYEMSKGRVLGHDISRIRSNGVDVWTNSVTIYDATYNDSGILVSENVKNTDYVTTASENYTQTQQGTEPPYTSQSTKTILELTEASKKYKYAKVTLQCRAYANYGDVEIYFNNSLVCKADNTLTTTVYIDLSQTLTGTSYISAENRSSEPTWGASGRIAVSNVVLVNRKK